MSSGHAVQLRSLPSEVRLDATLAVIRDRLEEAYGVDRGHDVPFLAGYSRDGKIIYIDRHMPKSFSYRGKTIDTDKFLILHERIEKALIDECGYGYWEAHRIAEHEEEKAERATGAPKAVFDKFYDPYIKADEHEKLVKVPANLDLTPYEAKPIDRALLAHLKSKMKEAA